MLILKQSTSFCHHTFNSLLVPSPTSVQETIHTLLQHFCIEYVGCSEHSQWEVDFTRWSRKFTSKHTFWFPNGKVDSITSIQLSEIKHTTFLVPCHHHTVVGPY
ncbi:hypothetical protein FRX31_017318 [Thalictrum thalictroides]|uniref:Uncharacterized protein n=1 Tax=Thalictrum thalictroides TaxID=46969 RepID=A0A7J6W8E4_THATH|nr:hypothetical protein FRX31_017318 [Thalictrum thalictroides]